MGQKERILRVLVDAEMPLKTGEIADRMGQSDSSIWRNLTKNLWEKEGKVELVQENPRKWVKVDDVNIDSNNDPPNLAGSTPDQKSNNYSLSLERDVQKYLAKNLSQLQDELTTKSDRTGKEVTVDSGRIDILAENSEDEPVVIEIKTGEAKHDALGQIQAYMSEVMKENSGNVTGIIVAEDFSTKLTSAVTIARNVELYTYEIEFDFEIY